MSASDRNPLGYGAAKRAAARALAQGEAAQVLRRVIPVAAPGTPIAGWIGVATNGAIRENSTGWITGSAAERAEAARVGRTPIRRGSEVYSPDNRSLWSNYGFHELGLFGVEGGRATGPAPGPGDHGSWHRLAGDATVRRVLGRAATTTPGAWVAVEDQVVLGVVNNIRHGRGVRGNLPEALRWPVNAAGDPAAWDCWAFACSTMGWSAGDAGAARHLALGAAEVARVPGPERWGAWLRWLVASGPTPSGGKTHRNPYYSACRTAQKLEAGRVAAEFTGEAGALSWLRGGLRDAEVAALYATLTARAYGTAGSSGSSGSSGGTTGGTTGTTGGTMGTTGGTTGGGGGGVLQRVGAWVWSAAPVLVPVGLAGVAVWRQRARRRALEV